MAQPLSPLGKFKTLLKTIKHNGGWVRSCLTLWYMDALKEGELVGTDCFGNKYYRNDRYFVPKNRWVVYHSSTSFNYDATMVPPMWYGWLHHKTDRLPYEDAAKTELCKDYYVQQWLTPHLEIKSGTPSAYYPYSTTPSTIQPWNGGTVWETKTQ